MFRKNKKLPKTFVPTGPVDYPTGTCVFTEDSIFFINSDGKRYRIISQLIADSWQFPLIVNSKEIALSKYPIAFSSLGFRDGTLLNNIADGKIYLVSGSKLRHVVSPFVLERLNLEASDALVVSDAEIKTMKVGEEIS